VENILSHQLLTGITSPVSAKPEAVKYFQEAANLGHPVFTKLVIEP
jgi:hypothetical protein